MEIKISKWGNSMAIRIPKSVLDNLNAHEGSVFNIFVKENKLIAEPIKKKYSLDELLEDVNEFNTHKETNTSIDVGNEILDEVLDKHIHC